MTSIAFPRGTRQHLLWILSAVGTVLTQAMPGFSVGNEAGPQPRWTIFIINDNCPDYTWGLTEAETRDAFAEIVRAHLDEMSRTDHERPESRNRYNAAVTQEVLCFVEKYPHRKQELIDRIRQGRLYVSPYLCNSLWGFQDVEGALRTFYPARRLEREWGIPQIDCGHHIELPSLPWGHATLLAGCGIKYLSIPYLAYDSTFNQLQVPPLFWHEGPDGSRVKVWLDVYACSRAGYTQGAHLLRLGDQVERDWLAHYARLGSAYPIRAVLASGTHGDISPQAATQARQFAAEIIRANNRLGPGIRFVNATLPMFWEVIEQAETASAWLGTVRGDFGHSWDLWPVSLAKYVYRMREAQRAFLSAEALLAMAASKNPAVIADTLPARRRAEWCWAMLSDHAWNGTDRANQKHNADLRRSWAEELARHADALTAFAWQALGAQPADDRLVLFNPLSFPRKAPVMLEIDHPDGITVVYGSEVIPSQAFTSEGKTWLCFLSPEVPAFGFCQLRLVNQRKEAEEPPRLEATVDYIEGPFYRAAFDRRSGGLASLVHKSTGEELARRGRQASPQRTLCQSVYHDGEEHPWAVSETQVVTCGPVLARVKLAGKLGPVDLTTFVTLYGDLDQVDFEIHARVPPTERKNRLCQVFPIVADGATVRIATTGAVIRPKPQPAGDLVPGADTTRFAVQEYVDCSTEHLGITLALIDPFVLRMGLDPITIQALGNDQNYREVTKDQNGETSFIIRYSLQARPGGFDGAKAMIFARSVSTPLVVFPGQLPEKLSVPEISVDPTRAVATCLKPADDPEAGGVILRLWELAGRQGAISIPVKGFGRAVLTDLLERDLAPTAIDQGNISLELKPHGFAALRLLP